MYRSWFAVLVASQFLVTNCHAKLPNIVVVLADDMGYGDVQALNDQSQIPTPNLNRLAKEGMTFTDAHSPSAVCTPTRYGLLTGRYCWRSRLKSGVLNGYSPPLIETDRMTVASFLKSVGYHTGIVGKWHLGLGFAKTDGGQFDFHESVDHGPNNLGFQFSHIIPASLDFPPYLYLRNGAPTKFPSIMQPAQSFPAFLRKGERSPDLVMEDCLDDLTQVATSYIRRQASNTEQPFFLYFPLTAPHKPVLPHPRFRSVTELGPYGDFIVQVDWTVGEVLNAIDQAGIRDDTLFLYTSDNGSFMFRRDSPQAKDHVADETVQAYQSAHHRANGAFRGTKADIWEAGHHVPFFARWPEVIKPDARCSETICHVDIFATVASIAEGQLPSGVAPDSHSLLSLMTDGSWGEARDPVIHHSASGMFSIRDGKWKLVLGNGSGGREQPRGKPFQKPYALFDMTKDISERTNVIDQFPDVATRLEMECLTIRDRES